MAKAKVKKPTKIKKGAPAKKAAPKAQPKAKAKAVSHAKTASSKAPAKKVGAPKEPTKKLSDKKTGRPQTASAPAKKQAAASKGSSLKEAAPKRQPLGPIEPGRLGQKRNCLECGTKFYDFERLPITCPKCFSEFEPEDFEPKISLKSESKKSRAPEKEEELERELVVSDSGEDFESLEDLNDDDSAVVGIGPDKDSDESFD